MALVCRLYFCIVCLLMLGICQSFISDGIGDTHCSLEEDPVDGLSLEKDFDHADVKTDCIKSVPNFSRTGWQLKVGDKCYIRASSQDWSKEQSMYSNNDCVLAQFCIQQICSDKCTCNLREDGMENVSLMEHCHVMGLTTECPPIPVEDRLDELTDEVNVLKAQLAEQQKIIEQLTKTIKAEIIDMVKQDLSKLFE